MTTFARHARLEYKPSALKASKFHVMESSIVALTAIASAFPKLGKPPRRKCNLNIRVVTSLLGITNSISVIDEISLDPCTKDSLDEVHQDSLHQGFFISSSKKIVFRKIIFKILLILH